jgi:hypothetical protein
MAMAMAVAAAARMLVRVDDGDRADYDASASSPDHRLPAISGSMLVVVIV